MHLGNCLDVMKGMDANSVDAVVTDPPYGLAFMGKKWDYDVPSVEIWREVLRVLKPGGFLLSFGGTRTYHRMVVNIEDAGFEIRDQIQWLYGSGFPKSHDVSKAIDKAKGAERTDLGPSTFANKGRTATHNSMSGAGTDSLNERITAPATPLAKQWQGFGTALKPANEPICIARKPLEGTVAQNVEKWGVGGLNIDGSRIAGKLDGDPNRFKKTDGGWFAKFHDAPVVRNEGRWPANLILDEVAAEMLGEPSRFFYVAKASKSERNAGLEGMPKVTARSGMGGEMPVDDDGKDRDRFSVTQANHHPTVKPVKLMEYLIKLVTPPNGTVLDPFMGSGSTGVACKNLGFNFIGSEMNAEYFEIAQRRIANAIR